MPPDRPPGAVAHRASSVRADAPRRWDTGRPSSAKRGTQSICPQRLVWIARTRPWPGSYAASNSRPARVRPARCSSSMTRCRRRPRSSRSTPGGTSQAPEARSSPRSGRTSGRSGLGSREARPAARLSSASSRSTETRSSAIRRRRSRSEAIRASTDSGSGARRTPGGSGCGESLIWPITKFYTFGGWGLPRGGGRWSCRSARSVTGGC